jgi:hypothetical protein
MSPCRRACHYSDQAFSSPAGEEFHQSLDQVTVVAYYALWLLHSQCKQRALIHNMPTTQTVIFLRLIIKSDTVVIRANERDADELRCHSLRSKQKG